MNDDFFESLKQTITETADVVTKKTGNIVESQKIKTKIYGSKRALEEIYKVLGKKVYDRFMAGETMDPEFAELCDKATEQLAEIKKFKDELAAKRGQCLCPKCGASNPIAATFCMNCGKELEKPQPEPEKPEDDIFEDLDEDEIFETVETPEAPADEDCGCTEDTCSCSEEQPAEENCGCTEDTCSCSTEEAPKQEEK